MSAVQALGIARHHRRARRQPIDDKPEHPPTHLDPAARAICRSAHRRLVALLFGGLCFGVAMTLSGGCANKNLVRVGGGSLRSVVVLVFLAIASYMTLKGLFGQWRASLLDPCR